MDATCVVSRDFHWDGRADTHLNHTGAVHPYTDQGGPTVS